jgi:hypothetical protein
VSTSVGALPANLIPRVPKACAPPPHLDLQEGVGDAADIVVSREAAHDEAAQDLAQHGHLRTIHLYRRWLHLADVHHQRHACTDGTTPRLLSWLAKCGLCVEALALSQRLQQVQLTGFEV